MLRTIAVARGLGIDVAYLPGLTMRRLADLHPGEGKTDARDAYVIAVRAWLDRGDSSRRNHWSATVSQRKTHA